MTTTVVDAPSTELQDDGCQMTPMVQALKAKLQADGYQITPPPANTMGCTFEARKGRDSVAVLVKEQKAKANTAQVQKFHDYLGLDVAKTFTAGWMISSSGFSDPALTAVNLEPPSNLRLGTFSGGTLNWDYPVDV